VIEWLIAVGASAGALDPLVKLVGGLPDDFDQPIALVKHRGADTGDDPLFRILGDVTSLRVVEVEDKQEIAGGCLYIAPAGYHTLIDEGHFALSMAAPLRFARPSIDPLFESAADCFGSRTLAVVLSGNSDDGARGALRVKQRGGIVLVQKPDTAECPRMPEATIATTEVDAVLSAGEMGVFLTRMTEKLATRRRPWGMTPVLRTDGPGFS
jgi:two-component system chemotaxis response regulator CheB